MIRTFKLKHGLDLELDLRKARQVAEFALKTRTLSTADVKQFGLRSRIAQGVLRKYSRNKKLKEVGSVKLTINNPTGFSVGNEWNVSIPDLKLVFSIPKPYRERFQKINQIEFDSKYAFFSCTFEDKPEYKPSSWIGVS